MKFATSILIASAAAATCPKQTADEVTANTTNADLDTAAWTAYAANTDLKAATTKALGDVTTCDKAHVAKGETDATDNGAKGPCEAEEAAHAAAVTAEFNG